MNAAPSRLQQVNAPPGGCEVHAVTSVGAYLHE